MINFANAGDAVKRLTGIVDAPSDYTCVFWWKLDLAADPTDDRIIFVTADDLTIYDDYAYIVSGGAGFIHLAIGHNGGEESTTSIAIETQTLYPIGYVREGTTHSFYFNGDMVGSVTEDISDATFGETWLGDDSNTNAALQNFYNFREWSRALSPAELLQEFTHPAAQSTVMLVTDTPLEDDLIDNSGNGNDWTAVGANSFLGTPPIYVSKYTAFHFGSPPFTGTFEAASSNLDKKYDLWFSFLGAPNTIFTGAFGWSSNAVYNPRIRVFYADGITPVINPGDLIQTRRIPVEFPTISGDLYYLQFVHASSTGGSSPLDLSVINHVPTIAPLNSFFINDDSSAVYAIIHSSLTNYLVHEVILGIAGGEGGDTTEVGRSLLENFTTGEVILYDTNYNQLAAFVHDLTEFKRIRTNWITQTFWYGRNANPVTLRSIDPVTALEGATVYTLTGVTGANGIATNNTETIVYVTGTAAGDPIKAWDLTNDVALPDFYAGLAGYKGYDIYVLPDNTILVTFYKESPLDLRIKRFNALGIEINEYLIPEDFDFALGPPRISWGQNPSISFWVMFHPQTPDYNKIIWREFDLSTGDQIGVDVLGAFFNGGVLGLGNAPAVNPPIARFGPSSSCPFFLTRSTTLPPAASLSGIYQMVPGKTNDTVFTDVNANITEVRKIPDPFYWI